MPCRSGSLSFGGRTLRVDLSKTKQARATQLDQACCPQTLHVPLGGIASSAKASSVKLHLLCS